MNVKEVNRALKRLQGELRSWQAPAVTEVARKREPFRVLISCILSLRTRDETTRDASRRLFAKARSPRGILALGTPEIERLIYPVGFYKTKARSLQAVCKKLLSDHGGEVPSDLDRLLELPGVGRKTANLVVTLGFGKPGICVDTHVHRISNRWGFVQTRTPEKTEMALRKCLPRRWWIPYNDLLVTFGQNICQPVSPRCSKCLIGDLCPRIGVGRHR